MSAEMETPEGSEILQESRGGSPERDAAGVPAPSVSDLQNCDYRTLLNHMPVPFWMKDAQGRYQVCNPAFEVMVNRTTDQIIGKSDFDLLGKATAEIIVREDLLTMMSSSPLTFEAVSRPTEENRPVRHMEITKAAIRNAAGDLVGILGTAFDITRQTTALQNLQEQLSVLEQAALHDPIIGSFNRFSLNNDINQSLTRHKVTGIGFAVVMVAVGGYRDIDNTPVSGIPYGMLAEYGKNLRTTISTHDRFGFWGDDRFVVILRDTTNLGVVESVIRRMSDLPPQVSFENGQVLRLEARFSHVLSRETDVDADDLIARLMDGNVMGTTAVAQKGTDRNPVYATMPVPTGFELEGDVEQAIQRDEFIAYFQPKIDLATQSVIGAEALVRWKHPKLGLIPPSMFIPMAEKTDRLRQINTKIWRDSMNFALQLNEGAPEPRKVAINISAIDLQMPEFMMSVRELMEATGCPAGFIEFEITESALKNRSEQLEAHLSDLGELGITLAIDDFGTGDLAFETLNRFAIGTLKIDRVFVHDIATNPKTARLVKAMCLMANELGLVTVAEGVETLKESEVVKQIGCRQAQGYFWLRPVPARQFFDWLAQRNNG